jgi:uncharacterized protein
MVARAARSNSNSIPEPQAGSVAVVTGASSGIGRELARLLCARGHDAVLVARRRDRLEQLASELRERYERRVEPVTCDLSDPASREGLLAQLDELGLTVEVLALAAGFGLGGPFTAHDPDRTQLMLRTNLEAVIALTRAFAPAMQDRRRGAILVVSSVTGHQPTPNMAAYAASKAAVTSFTEALHEELRHSGIAVTALCPGPVNTEFVDVAGMGHTARRTRLLFSDPDQVATAGIDGLAENRRIVIPGIPARALALVGGHAPRALWLPICRHLMA